MFVHIFWQKLWLRNWLLSSCCSIKYQFPFFVCTYPSPTPCFGRQQDAQEFLRYLLEGLHIEVNRVTKRPHPVIPDYAAEDRLADREKAEIYWKRYLAMDNSEIVDLFVGQLMSTLECTECGFKSTTFDPFWDLSLPIPKKTNVNIVDCLRLFTSKEDLDGNERPICGRCKVRRRCTKSFSIQKFPRILVLHLKRFSGERFRSKMSLLVDYPITDLNMIEYASPSCKYILCICMFLCLIIP
ncbi:Ubiquitin carboxyl-terminal hydrolase 2 [Fasciolopsis buskii]|uniref:ubiquitinyl hydrolase 1 n=1 Tax=Fasciolopsis buskii TaxID=27845 RepID=A0A8E0RSF5_9TREM|nr:Ubiquitin carboxyl-terminal hydrolase 2 [Fasciolopsis buski]